MGIKEHLFFTHDLKLKACRSWSSYFFNMYEMCGDFVGTLKGTGNRVVSIRESVRNKGNAQL